MSKKLVFLTVVFIVVAISQATILDQSQEQFDAYFRISDQPVAQIFTAGITGQLEKIELRLENFEFGGLYPTTISIVETTNGVPNGSLLGSIYADNLVEGYNTFDFLSESVFLSANTKYAVVLDNDDPDPYEDSITFWCCTQSDVYAGGALWLYFDGEWVENLYDETFYDKDAVFRTYMVPEPITLILFGLGAIFANRIVSVKTMQD